MSAALAMLCWGMDSSSLTLRYAGTHHVFTHTMLKADGVPSATYDRWLRTGVIRRVAGKGLVHHSVAPTTIQRAMAVHLTWPDAIICLRTAASLLAIPVEDQDPDAVDVLVPDGRKPVVGIRPHRWSVRPTDVALCDGVPVTDRLTTLADCLGRLPADDAWGLLAWMWTREMVTAEEIEAQISERWHLYGVVRLRRMAMAVRRGALSEGEIALHEFLEASGFVGWAGDQKIFRPSGRIAARVDVLFVAERVVVEYDGRLAHDETTEHDDGARDALLCRLGYVVIHVRWWQLHDDPGQLRRDIKAALAEAAARQTQAEEAELWGPGRRVRRRGPRESTPSSTATM